MFYKVNVCFGILLALFVQTQQTVVITSNLTSSQIRDIEENVSRKCLVKYNMGLGTVTEFIHDWSLSPTITKNLKCFFGCILENMGVLKDKKLDWDLIKLERELASSKDKKYEIEFINTCQPKVKNDEEHCEMGFNLANCMKDELMERGRKEILKDNSISWFELSTFVTCRNKFKVNDHDAMAVLVGGKTEDRNVKCVMRCIDEILGLVNRETKKLDWDSREKLERARLKDRPNQLEHVLKYISSCKEKGMQDLDDECESSYLATECFTQAYHTNETSSTTPRST